MLLKLNKYNIISCYYRGGSRILKKGPKAEGEARIEGAKRLRIEGEGEKAVGGVCGGAR